MDAVKKLQHCIPGSIKIKIGNHCILFSAMIPYFYLSVNNVISSRPIGYHGDWEAQFFFHKFNVFAAVFR